MNAEKIKYKIVHKATGDTYKAFIGEDAEQHLKEYLEFMNLKNMNRNEYEVIKVQEEEGFVQAKPDEWEVHPVLEKKVLEGKEKFTNVVILYEEVQKFKSTLAALQAHLNVAKKAAFEFTYITDADIEHQNVVDKDRGVETVVPAKPLTQVDGNLLVEYKGADYELEVDYEEGKIGDIKKLNLFKVKL